MITLHLHFQCGFACEVANQDLPSSNGLVVTYRGTDVAFFFPTRAIRDAVRDALLQCPGCVARPEVEAVPTPSEPVLGTFAGVPFTQRALDRFVDNERAFNGMVANAVFGTPLPPPQPAAQGGGGDGGGGTAGATGTGGQPAVQAMDAVEDWEMPF